MAKYEITILINVLCSSWRLGGEARVSIMYSTSIFISNSLLAWFGLGGWRVDHLVVWLFTVVSLQHCGVWLQAGCKVRDLRQFRHLSVTPQSSHSGCVERERGEIFSYKHLSCITAALPVITYCLHFLPWLAVILNKHHNTTMNGNLTPGSGWSVGG